MTYGSLVLYVDRALSSLFSRLFLAFFCFRMKKNLSKIETTVPHESYPAMLPMQPSFPLATIDYNASRNVIGYGDSGYEYIGDVDTGYTEIIN